MVFPFNSMPAKNAILEFLWKKGRAVARTDRIPDYFIILQGQVNRIWSSFELVGDRRLFTCCKSVCQCGI